MFVSLSAKLSMNDISVQLFNNFSSPTKREPEIDPSWLVCAVDCALAGSEYGLEAWKMIKNSLETGVPFTISEISELEELLDRAQDDLEGPELTVDLSINRLYGS